jgi:hypothetical protein
MGQNHLCVENVGKLLLLKVIGGLMKRIVVSFGIALVVQILNTKDLSKIILDLSEKDIIEFRVLMIELSRRIRRNVLLVSMKLLGHDLSIKNKS